jgi:hypothetical protein
MGRRLEPDNQDFNSKKQQPDVAASKLILVNYGFFVPYLLRA